MPFKEMPKTVKNVRYQEIGDILKHRNHPKHGVSLRKKWRPVKGQKLDSKLSGIHKDPLRYSKPFDYDFREGGGGVGKSSVRSAKGHRKYKKRPYSKFFDRF